MDRISSSAPHTGFQRNLRRQESAINKVERQIGTQNRIQSLRDDPIAAGRVVRSQSFVNRLDQFEKNARTLVDRISYSEGYINSNLQILQRVRELAVTGANGTYTPEDLKIMAGEVNQLLMTMVDNANATGAEGTALFAGTKTNSQAFEVTYGNVPGAGSAVITEVRYNGNIDMSKIEVDERHSVMQDRSGNRIFWAEPQTVFSNTDSSQYVVGKDSVINVDGHEILITAGDNMYSVIAKINNSGAAVKASVDPISNGINISTTDARQLWMQDLGESTILQDLGLISSGNAPNNIAAGATAVGGSAFDAVIALRDAMLSGDSHRIGGSALGAVSSAVDNVANHLAKTGSLYEQLEANIARTGKQIPDVTAAISREKDVDMAEAITEMKMLDFTKQATLNMAARLYSNSILNYMR